RAASLPKKSFESFRAVRDLKVQGYQNLRHAFWNRPPRMWCNFGSFVGFTGQIGELDYASGNDFLGTAAEYTSRSLGGDEFTVCWTVWSEVGMVQAHPLTSALTKRMGRYSSM